MKRRLLMALGRVSGTVAAVVIAVWITIAQPTLRTSRSLAVTVDPIRLKTHVTTLCETMHPRNCMSVSNLDSCARYIEGHFVNAGARVEMQEFTVNRKVFRNVIGRFGDGERRCVIVGAHYDTCDDTPGADDNASGTAALIELAYLLGKSPTGIPVELVAYTLEEPPFFRTGHMGSAVHAKRFADAKRPAAGMISLEMVGYYSDEWKSQSYPVLLLRLIYPSRGNFISVIGRWDQGAWIKGVKAGMKGATDLPVYSMRAPSFLQGIDYSDHFNYWRYGIPALMVTDTAFYRNMAYHTPDDVPERLDYSRLAKVVAGVYASLQSLGAAKEEKSK